MIVDTAEKEAVIDRFVSLAIKNLELIKNSSSESIHRSNLILEDFEELLPFLLDCDFIETEVDENVFFLSSNTYDLLESDLIESEIWQNIEFHFENDIEDDFELTDEELEIKEKEFKIRLKEEKIGSIALLLFILFLGSWYMYNHSDSFKEEYSPNLSENEIRIITSETKNLIDSIRKNK